MMILPERVIHVVRALAVIRRVSAWACSPAPAAPAVQPFRIVLDVTIAIE
jgi:hypothetical protein